MRKRRHLAQPRLRPATQHRAEAQDRSHSRIQTGATPAHEHTGAAVAHAARFPCPRPASPAVGKALLSVTVSATVTIPRTWDLPTVPAHQGYSLATAPGVTTARQPQGAEEASPSSKGLRIQVAGRARKLFCAHIPLEQAKRPKIPGTRSAFLSSDLPDGSRNNGSRKADRTSVRRRQSSRGTPAHSQSSGPC